AIDVSMVVDSENEHQIEEFREHLTPLCDRVQFIPRLIKGQRQDPCREPSRGVIVVLSDGTLTACCADARGKLSLGHIEAGRLDQQYRSDPWVALRKQHARGDYPEPCASCSECSVPGVSPRFS
ncbi:MAG: SPASM domain-containing protein, partial [Planctomycetota bacterium]|nr:SPASM domain-containing protein [Planctomycetota bacterium]